MIKYEFPLSSLQALVFLNGICTNITKIINIIADYHCVIAADGAWDRLQKIDSMLLKDNMIKVLGDGDSIRNKPKDFIETFDQNNTDFEKIILYLLNNGISSADIYWGSGGEMDHFLGNLSVAAKYNDAMSIRFFDKTHCYFYINRDFQVIGAENKKLTLYPFPKAIVSSKGLQYKLNNSLLRQKDKQSLRNKIVAKEAKINLHNGSAFVFIER